MKIESSFEACLSLLGIITGAAAFIVVLVDVKNRISLMLFHRLII
jgi:hypothetical protein